MNKLHSIAVVFDTYLICPNAGKTFNSLTRKIVNNPYIMPVLLTWPDRRYDFEIFCLNGVTLEAYKYLKVANPWIKFLYEPHHDKTNKMTVRPAKTQISLDIRQV